MGPVVEQRVRFTATWIVAVHLSKTSSVGGPVLVDLVEKISELVDLRERSGASAIAHAD